MKKTVISLLGLSLVITNSVPAYGMWSRLSSKVRNCMSLRFTKPLIAAGVATSGISGYMFNRKPVADKKERLEIGPLQVVYNPGYDIGFFGIEKLHPFDSSKYSKVFGMLQNRVADKIQTHEPTEITDEELARVHTPEYLKQLREDSSNMMARISEVPPLAYLPNWVTRRQVQKPMRLATGGTVLASRLAVQHGRAVNLSGGYHHAKSASGEGFCAYADIPLAVYKLLDSGKVKKVLVVDLDAHQGNGLESIFKNDPKVDVFDMYNGCIYPHDQEAAQYIRYNFPLANFTQDEEYLKVLQKNLPKAIRKSKPDLIVYNAGTDLYEKDPLGRLCISEEGILKRDKFVFQSAQENGIPITMVLSGGYTQESAPIIGKSLISIVEETNNQ